MRSSKIVLAICFVLVLAQSFEATPSSLHEAATVSAGAAVSTPGLAQPSTSKILPIKVPAATGKPAPSTSTGAKASGIAKKAAAVVQPATPTKGKLPTGNVKPAVKTAIKAKGTPAPTAQIKPKPIITAKTPAAPIKPTGTIPAIKTTPNPAPAAKTAIKAKGNTAPTAQIKPKPIIPAKTPAGPIKPAAPVAPITPAKGKTAVPAVKTNPGPAPAPKTNIKAKGTPAPITPVKGKPVVPAGKTTPKTKPVAPAGKSTIKGKGTAAVNGKTTPVKKPVTPPKVTRACFMVKPEKLQALANYVKVLNK
jgi:hypothetical protein